MTSCMKARLRCCRNTFRDLLNRPAERARLDKGVYFVDLPLDPSQSSFFGYYTRSPWNCSGDILFQETRGRAARPSLKHPLVLKVFRSSTNEVIPIGETRAWNWQQGCMLQWLGPEGNRVIYNKYDPHNDAYRSVIVEVTGAHATTICQPIYSVNSQGTLALTLDFSRLARLRPDYGYFNRCRRGRPRYGTKSLEKLSLSKDGVWAVDLVRNESRLILSLKNLIEFEHSEDMDGVEHKVNHVDISPDGSRFLFLHRWFTRRGKMTRLLTADMDGRNLYCLANDNMVSHCIWKNERQILAWARKKGIGDRYFLFTDRSLDYQVIGEGQITEDGHPSFSPNGRWLLTDTYPSKNRMSSLLLFDLDNEKLTELGAFFQPYRFSGELRCDLHPRWSPGGRFVSFDSCHSGRRRFYVLDVRKSIRCGV